MRKLALMIMVLCAAGFGTALADETSSGQAHVFVNVNPNIAVQPLAPIIDLGTMQTGLLHGLITYRVDANTEGLMFWAAASNLYKGNDPNNNEVPPIAVDLPSGVEITAQFGNPIGGHSNVANYTGPVDVGGFPGFITEQIQFESSQNGHFSQEASTVITWTQPDNEKPMGEYSGNVQLWAMTVLP